MTVESPVDAGLDLDRDACPATDAFRQELECLHQAEVVEYPGPQFVRQAAQLFLDVVEVPPHVLQPLSRGRRQRAGHLRERNVRSGQELAGLVVQDAGNALGLVLELVVEAPQRLLDARGHLAPRHPLAAVHARLDPVELGQHVVGQVEPAVGQDVALDPAQHAERRQPRVGGGDLLALAADFVGGQPADGTDGRRVVADREVLVAALDRGARHLLDAGRPIGVVGVAVHRAAHVVLADQGLGELAGVGGPQLVRAVADLGRKPGEIEAGVEGRLVG